MCAEVLKPEESLDAFLLGNGDTSLNHIRVRSIHIFHSCLDNRNRTQCNRHSTPRQSYHPSQTQIHPYAPPIVASLTACLLFLLFSSLITDFSNSKHRKCNPAPTDILSTVGVVPLQNPTRPLSLYTLLIVGSVPLWCQLLISFQWVPCT